jgi:phage shock protein PspC (stress-responsive transcriptional regulator)
MQPTASEQKRRLYRSTTDRMLGGVCGGIGNYLEIDPILVRLVFVLLALSGVSIALYVLLWVLIPDAPQGEFGSSETVRTGAEEIAERARSLAGETSPTAYESNRKIVLLVGVALIFWGIAALARAFHIPWLWWFDWDVFWPALLIAAGIALIWRRMHNDTRQRPHTDFED